MTTDIDTAQMALYRRDGSICGWVTLDADQLEWASQWQWHLSAGGYAVRSERLPNGILLIRSLHREVLGLPPYGVPKVRFVTRDRLDVRKCNLRLSHRWVAGAVGRNDDVAARLLLLAIKGSNRRSDSRSFRELSEVAAGGADQDGTTR